jgi:Tfp pilus assembly protein PilX
MIFISLNNSYLCNMARPTKAESKQTSFLTPHLALNSQNKQKGSSLYMSVIVLFLVALSGLTIFSSSLINQKVAANYIHKNISYQAVENAFTSLLSEARSEWQVKMPTTQNANVLTKTVTNNTPGAETTLTTTYLRTAKPNAHEIPDGYPLSLIGNYYQADVSGQYARANSTHRMKIVAFSPTSASGTDQNHVTLVAE